MHLPSSVLVIDNDADTLQIVSRLLRAWGLRVDTAESAPEGLELYGEARAGGRPYGLILTDAGMPVMNGVEFVERLRAGLGDSETPVAILTAYRESMMTAKARAAGADDVLFKPIDPDTLKARIFGLLEARSAESDNERGAPH